MTGCGRRTRIFVFALIVCLLSAWGHMCGHEIKHGHHIGSVFSVTSATAEQTLCCKHDPGNDHKHECSCLCHAPLRIVKLRISQPTGIDAPMVPHVPENSPVVFFNPLDRPPELA